MVDKKRLMVWRSCWPLILCFLSAGLTVGIGDIFLDGKGRWVLGLKGRFGGNGASTCSNLHQLADRLVASVGCTI